MEKTKIEIPLTFIIDAIQEYAPDQKLFVFVKILNQVEWADQEKNFLSDTDKEEIKAWLKRKLEWIGEK